MDIPIEPLLGYFLSGRTHSEHEVRSYLSRKSTQYPTSQETIDWLVKKYKDLGYINDTKFVEEVIHSYLHSRAKGRRYLQSKLMMAGIEKSVIESALSSIPKDDVYEAMAKRISKYNSKLQLLDKKGRYQKSYNYLLLAGFSSSEIRSYLDETEEKE